MKRIVVLLLCICVLFTTMIVPISAEIITGTMIRKSAADPWLCYYDGYYFLTVTGKTKIAVFQSKTIGGFASMNLNNNIVYDSAEDKTVEDLYGKGATLSGTWSPELHYFTEEEAPGNSGWYMFLALRNNTGDSRQVNAVIMKSTSGSPKGPYAHPVTGEKNQSQQLLGSDGKKFDNWAIGQSVLKISEGEYRGIYTMWVTEEGRGQSGKDGKFFQKLMIAKMKNPWTVASEPSIITTPTQSWEFAGSSTKYPRVVEGATALYGTRGDVYITYSGSGYWSDYGLGQLTWTGDDPLQTSSWVKLPDKATDGVSLLNPIFQAKRSADLRGAGHASFVCDKDGRGFLVYHAYPYANGKKADSRNAYIEPYYIDYEQYNGVSYGVIRMGVNDNRITAPTSNTTISFTNIGNALSAPTLTAESRGGITLSMNAKNATGYTIYRSADGETFEYLASVDDVTYTDETAEYGETYYYRAYAYRNQELSPHSETVSAVSAEEASAGVTEPPNAAPSGPSNTLVIWVSCISAAVAVGAVCVAVVLKKKKII